MSLQGRVVWQEGMFLRAQHFQQQERWVEHVLHRLHACLGPHMWGVQRLDIDRGALGMGKFALLEATGVFADGTPFSFPHADAGHPPPVDVPEAARNQLIYLALPTPPPHAMQVADGQQGTFGRIQAVDQPAADTHSDSPEPAQLVIGRLCLRLLREDQDRGGYQCIPVARVRDVSPNRSIALDEQFMAPALQCHAVPLLTRFLAELVNMMNRLGEELAGRMGGGGGRVRAEHADFLILQTTNRWLPLLRHWALAANLHPERLYEALSQIAGEWSGFTNAGMRADEYPPYRHDDLQSSFTPLIDALRRLIPAGIGPGVVEIPLVELRYGVRRGTIADRALLKSARFYLVVTAAMPGEALRRLFTAKAKIGPIERMPDLVASAVSGIKVAPLQQVPQRVPWQADANYFELDRGSPLWPQLDNSAAFGIHVSDEPPGMKMQLWAVSG